MFLSIDIGNTNIDLGLFQDDRLLLHCKLPAGARSAAEDFVPLLRDLLAPHLGPVRLAGAAIGSVVKDLGDALERACRDLGARLVLQVEATWDLGLEIDYHPPERVGIDRLVAAAAAFARAPAGSGAVVADAGTAITVDAVSADGTFLGGLILPGLRLSLRSLHQGTSLLPEIELRDDVPLLGRSTLECMQAGLIHGSAALVDGLCARIAARLSTPVCGFLTGGDGECLWPHLVRYAHFAPALVLEGLRLAYQRRAALSY